MSFIHGHARVGRLTRTFKAWHEMKKRCFYKKSSSYPDYGGRGITVCPEWVLFTRFLEDMGECPEGMSLDRINNNGNYESSNCRWATKEQQANNKRNTRHITIGAVTMTRAQWCRYAGIKSNTAAMRAKYGWPVERIFNVG